MVASPSASQVHMKIHLVRLLDLLFLEQVFFNQEHVDLILVVCTGIVLSETVVAF